MKTLPIRPIQSVPTAERPPVNAGQVVPWRFAWLLAAPHRLAFASGALMLFASALWWALMLGLRASGWAVPHWALSAGLAHSLWLGLGFMPLFFVGFLFTAGPKWLGLPPVAAQRLLGGVLAMLSGWLVFLMGVHLSAALAGIGLLAVAWGWSSLALDFVRLLRRSPVQDKRHAQVVAAAALTGAAAFWLAAFGLLAGQELLARVAVQLALWGFLLPVYLAVAHRMIPFFTASAVPTLDAWRPLWLLWVFLGLAAWEGVFAIGELLWWPLPTPLRALQAVVELGFATLTLWLALRWGLLQSLKIRLLAMLHLGFVWLGLALAMAALSHGLMAFSQGQLSLGLAPLHLTTLGFLGSLLVAMATRVSCGHGGRALAADDLAWALFWTLQAAVLLRLAAALLPAWGTTLAFAAALAWLAAMGGWALRYGAWFGRPRADGRPG